MSAYRRYEISEIVFEQRARMCARLRDAGINANCVVVADDDNLALAEQNGFASIRQENDGLGARYNAGYRFAAAQGADFVSLVGSNSFLDPEPILAAIPEDGRHITYSEMHAFVNETGTRRADVRLAYLGGHRTIFPLALLAGCDYRPIPDGSAQADTWLVWSPCKCTPDARWEIRNGHSLEAVGFKTGTPQLRSYSLVVRRFGGVETDDPLGDLRSAYPGDLVDRIEAFYRG